jgi:hypothetical protein
MSSKDDTDNLKRTHLLLEEMMEFLREKKAPYGNCVNACIMLLISFCKNIEMNDEDFEEVLAFLRRGYGEARPKED